jgi:hypothetical protein
MTRRCNRCWDYQFEYCDYQTYLVYHISTKIHILSFGTLHRGGKHLYCRCNMVYVCINPVPGTCPGRHVHVRADQCTIKWGREFWFIYSVKKDLLWVVERRQSTHDSKLSNEVTYSLWAGYGDVESVHGSAAIQQDHIQSLGEWWEKQSQCVILQLSSKITYSLWVDDERDRVSAWFCTFPAGSCTICGWDRISALFCSYPARSHTFCYESFLVY